MMQRTYAVFGLMEYTINVTLGSRQLKIPFTDGIASKDGVRPATYTTSNPVVQFAIESSKHFKSGRVKILKTIGEAAPDAISVSEAKAAREKAEAAAKEKAAEDNTDKDATPEADKTEEEKEEAPEANNADAEEKEIDEAADTEDKQAETQGTDEEETTSNGIKVSCWDDAREYLISNCGGKAKTLRSKKAVLEYAAAHNVVFVGLE